MKSVPLGKFDRSTGTKGDGTARVGQGGSLKFGLDMNPKWRLTLTPFQQNVFSADLSFLNEQQIQRMPDVNSWEIKNISNWKATQSKFGIDRIFKPFGDRITITAGASLGTLHIESPSVEVKTDSERVSTGFWSMFGLGGKSETIYHKKVLLKSATSNVPVYGLNTDISLRFSKHLTLQAGVEMNYAKAKFRNVNFSYTNDRNNEPDKSFETTVNFNQQYLATHFKLGLNYQVKF